MGRRGPAPEPTALKRAKGVYPYRINSDEPQPIEGNPLTPPRWLSPDAAEGWRMLAPNLLHMRCLTTADLPGFAAYCECFVRWRRLAELAATAEILIPGREDTMVRNPVFQMVRDAGRELLQWSREFGLTPSARSGIRVEHVITGDAARLLTDAEAV